MAEEDGCKVEPTVNFWDFLLKIGFLIVHKSFVLSPDAIEPSLASFKSRSVVSV